MEQDQDMSDSCQSRTRMEPDQDMLDSVARVGPEGSQIRTCQKVSESVARIGR